MIPDVNLALMLLNSLLGYIANVRAQGGLNDDALASQVQTVTQGNDKAYDALMGAINTHGSIIDIKPVSATTAAPIPPAKK